MRFQINLNLGGRGVGGEILFSPGHQLNENRYPLLPVCAVQQARSWGTRLPAAPGAARTTGHTRRTPPRPRSSPALGRLSFLASCSHRTEPCGALPPGPRLRRVHQPQPHTMLANNQGTFDTSPWAQLGALWEVGGSWLVQPENIQQYLASRPRGGS